MNVYIRKDLVKRMNTHNIEDTATFVNESVEKALDMLDLADNQEAPA